MKYFTLGNKNYLNIVLEHGHLVAKKKIIFLMET